jgi:aspartate racemase
LVAGEVLPESRAAYRKIIAGLIAQGAQAIILGCTEIMLLVSQEDSAVPLITHWPHRTIKRLFQMFGSGWLR